MPKQQGDSVDDRVRARLRDRRLELGWSLDELAERSGVNASTLSRIETGGRRIALDVLSPVAASLGLSLDELVRAHRVDDIVIRPSRSEVHGMTVWPLDPARRTGLPSVMKLRIPDDGREPEPISHPGHEWIYVLDGTLRLIVDETEHRFHPGQTIAFSTTSSHWHGATDGPVELLVIFDEHAQRNHLE